MKCFMTERFVTVTLSMLASGSRLRFNFALVSKLISIILLHFPASHINLAPASPFPSQSPLQLHCHHLDSRILRESHLDLSMPYPLRVRLCFHSCDVIAVHSAAKRIRANGLSLRKKRRQWRLARSTGNDVSTVAISVEQLQAAGVGRGGRL